MYEGGAWDEPLLWLNMESSATMAEPSAEPVLHGDGGDLLLYGDNSRGLVRFARFRFRPSHADCLHLDLWHGGQNILRDGGTFSYIRNHSGLIISPGRNLTTQYSLMAATRCPGSDAFFSANGWK